jgi:hypothetical protein
MDFWEIWIRNLFDVFTSIAYKMHQVAPKTKLEVDFASFIMETMLLTAMLSLGKTVALSRVSIGSASRGKKYGMPYNRDNVYIGPGAKV